MKKLAFMITVIVIVAIAFICYYNSGGEKLNLTISSDIHTAKQLSTIANKYVDEYWDGRKKHIGMVTMKLSKKQKGFIEIWYVDEKLNRNNVPHIISVEIDTNENKILRILNQPRDTKLVPNGEITLDKWDIDSDEAIKIAMDSIEKNEFPDDIFIIASSEYGSKQTWQLTMWYKQDNEAYNCIIDPFTGDVLKKYLQ